MLELTLFLVNVLLIIIIITVYVKLSMTIKNQGTQFAILLKQEKEAFKEAMSPAMRISRARRNKDEVNQLMPSWHKNPEYDGPSFEPTYRGADASKLMPTPKTIVAEPETSAADVPAEITNVTVEEVGAINPNAISAVGELENVKAAEAAVPEPAIQTDIVQSGVLSEEELKQESYSVNPRVASSIIGMGSFSSKNKVGRKGF